MNLRQESVKKASRKRQESVKKASRKRQESVEEATEFYPFSSILRGHKHMAGVEQSCHRYAGYTESVTDSQRCQDDKQAPT
jgi:uncharacterized phosphosugar-binding protein